jgi:hypothetical protein
MLEELTGGGLLLTLAIPAEAGDFPTNGFNLLLVPNTRRP